MQTHETEIGEYRTRSYFLRLRAAPNYNTPVDFAVTVYYRDADREERIEIARIDTSHGYTHFDKLYHREQPKEEVDMGLWQAAEKLESEWRRYAKQYHRNHE